MIGIDIASRVDSVFANCLRAKGYSFIIRYLDDTFGRSNKCISESEAQQILAAALDIFLVYETCGGSDIAGCTPGAAYFTRDQGIYDAQHAQVQAHDVLHHTDGKPIFFAVDFNAVDADLSKMVDYFNGIYDVLSVAPGAYPIGIYGSYETCKYARDNWPAVKYYYQTYAWSGGMWLPEAHLKQTQNAVQLCGREVDLDESVIRGWYMATEFVTKADFEAYKLALQTQLDATYAKLVHGHDVSVSVTGSGMVNVTGSGTGKAT